MTDEQDPIEQERRAYRRRSIRIPVGIGHAAGTHSCETLNVSRSGICCLVDHPIPLFTKVQVSLVFPDEQGNPAKDSPMECEGIVVRQEQTAKSEDLLFETAIFFQNVNAETAREIEKHIHVEGL